MYQILLCSKSFQRFYSYNLKIVNEGATGLKHFRHESTRVLEVPTLLQDHWHILWQLTYISLSSGMFSSPLSTQKPQNPTHSLWTSINVMLEALRERIYKPTHPHIIYPLMCQHTLYKYVHTYLWAIHVWIFMLTHPHDFLQVHILLLYPMLFPQHIFFHSHFLLVRLNYTMEQICMADLCMLRLVGAFFNIFTRFYSCVDLALFS